ncbi:MAG: mannose-1-phosphate guanylyltransferase/mannose-6-phosphate isomerase [Deltaproteobacteria bacterium]|nr:mannose-1-phosphate guanylyltransferase/mannose-6-phosphate isomerase [Deltaproteobacteria bacterium]
MKETLYGIILAGGVGSRFWPLSRVTSPKQLLKIAGDESLLKTTIKRLSPLIPQRRISIVTNSAQAEIIRLHLYDAGHPSEGWVGGRGVELVVEPFGRNTAPAIGLAALKLLQKDPDCVMAVLPSDHLIARGETFRRTLRAAAAAAREGYLVTFGVIPTRPETGYGYIKTGGAIKTLNNIKVKKVERFVEKPELKKAKRYLKEGGYYWNSGIFVWKAGKILDEIRLFLPSLYKNLLSIQRGAAIEEAYEKMESISIDHGVLEKTEDIAVIEADFPWSDMGSLNSLKEVFSPDRDGNIMKGRVVDIGSKRSFIIGSDRVVATIGLKDMILVDTPDATLVCPRDRTQEVKEVVDVLKKRGYAEHESHITVERPWGAYTVLEAGDHYKIKKVMVLPGRRLSLQMHRKRSEHWVVISGAARVERDGKVFMVKENESTFIPKGAKHRLGNPSRKKPLELIEVQNGSYVGEDDIVRFKDDYERG